MTNAEQIARERFSEDLYGIHREDLIYGFIEGYKYAERERTGNTSNPPRQSCRSRLACICADVQKAHGFHPFNGFRYRDTVSVYWRQVIVTQLRKEGYSLHQIGRATNYSHSTVCYHVGRVEDALKGYDPELLDVWRELQQAIEPPRYYGN